MTLPPQVVLSRALNWAVEPVTKRGVPESGECRWCSTHGPLVNAIPSTFTQWDQIGVSPSEPWLCPDCAGALIGLKPVRWGHAAAATDGTGLMSADPADLKTWLERPVDVDRAVMVQTNRQKRSVLAARWGAVATTYDVPAVSWGPGDADRLAAHHLLRWEHSVSEREIWEPAPRPSTMGASPDPAGLLDLWRQVKGWDPVRLEISCLATRQAKPCP